MTRADRKRIEQLEDRTRLLESEVEYLKQQIAVLHGLVYARLPADISGDPYPPPDYPYIINALDSRPSDWRWTEYPSPNQELTLGDELSPAVTCNDSRMVG